MYMTFLSVQVLTLHYCCKYQRYCIITSLNILKKKKKHPNSLNFLIIMTIMI
jgi:hypothetical protein